jgi:DNA-binding MarR family transcriptional regulator
MEKTQGQDFDLTCFLPYQLNQVAEMVSKAFQDCYQRDFGLTRTQWRILAHLASVDGMTAKEIGARVHEDKVSISRGVVGLEAKGHLHRISDPRDRRAERLHLTESGRAVFAAVAERARDFEASLARDLGSVVIETLQASLIDVQTRWQARPETLAVSG